MSEPTPARLVWVYTGRLAEALDAATWLETTRELERLGWDVTLIDAGAGESSVLRGVRVHHAPRPAAYLVGQAVFHARLLPRLFERETAPDAVIYHQMSALWMLAARVIRTVTLQRRPLLVLDLRTLHMPPPGKQSLRDRLRGAYYRFVERVGHIISDGQLAITPRLAVAAGISESRLWGTWPSGVRLEDFETAGRTRTWPTSDQRIRLIYIGSLMHERNLDSLCEAVEAANEGGAGFELTLVGEGTARKELERIAAGSTGQIRVLPKVPYERVGALLRDYHVGVLPFPDEDKFRVSSPIKLFEYLASGMPVMATAIACHTDVVGDDVTFWARGSDSAALGAALRDIWSRRGELPNMGSAATLVSGQFTWRAAAERLDAALRSGIGRSTDLAQVKRGLL